MIVYKFPIRPTTGTQTIHVPAGGEFLNLRRQPQGPVIYMLVDPNAELVERTFHVVYTGDDFTPPGPYIGTLDQGGRYYHVFEVTP